MFFPGFFNWGSKDENKNAYSKRIFCGAAGKVTDYNFSITLVVELNRAF